MALLAPVLYLPALATDSFGLISLLLLSFVFSWQPPSAFAFLDLREDELQLLEEGLGIL